MKTLSTKQMERSEKKKKKLAALANLVNLNDQDRVQKLDHSPPSKDNSEQSALSSNMEEDGFVMVTQKKKGHKNKASHAQQTESNSEEPEQKRSKLNSMHEEDDCNSVISVSSSQNEELQQLKINLSEQQYKDLKRQLRERKRQLENVPSLRLREQGQRASVDVPQEQRTPIFLTDIQHLLMSALIGKKSPCSPERWCYLDKPLRLSHSVVLILEGLSLYHYAAHESKFAHANKIFETRLELMMPPSKDDILEELAQIPLTNVQAHNLIEQHGSLEIAMEMTKDPTLLVKAIFPMDENYSSNTTQQNLPVGDNFPRTKLLLSALQMVDEGYPMPLRGELCERFKHYVFTSSKYLPVTDQSPMYAVDCEMCRTASGCNELTRISIVNEKYETVYETLVMPSHKIVDYLTPYSGITAEVMRTVTKSLKSVQDDVRKLLPPNAILVGQSLNSDLNAMQMMHPYVIDTSVCFNISGVRKRKSKLQKLALTFLKETIQDNADGHDSVEDSIASLKLVKMKLANSLEFGDEILVQKKRIYDIIKLASGEGIKQNLFAHATQLDKRTAILTAGDLQAKLKQILQKAQSAAPNKNANSGVSLFELGSNKEAMRKTREVSFEHTLTVTNLHLDESQLLPNECEQTMEKVDKWINKLWNTAVAHNGLFVVLMSGSTECPSGLAKIAIKKCVAQVAAELPLNV